MADITKNVREYLAIYHYDDNEVSLGVRGLYEDQQKFSHIPTRAELEVLFSASGFEIDISDCFQDCVNMIAAPKLPEEIEDSSRFDGLTHIFENCTALKSAPKLPNAKYNYYAFSGCTALREAPVIPQKGRFLSSMFYNCTSLEAPVSIPPDGQIIDHTYEGCTALAGEMVVRLSSVSPTDTFKNTTGSIILYGDQTVCERIATTANNNNVSWQPWYDPEPAVTDRGPGSYTTAADMTRMVRNGALAVNTYAPGRMVYRAGDIVRQDEWEALVAAAQTIDATVTSSTAYTNLNRIEAAFDSAL